MKVSSSEEKGREETAKTQRDRVVERLSKTMMSNIQYYAIGIAEL